VPGQPDVFAVSDLESLAGELSARGVPLDRPVLVCVGGAGGMTDEVQSALTALLAQHIVPSLDHWGGVVIDGGTDSGLMRALGRARETAGARFPLVGVAAGGTVGGGDVALEPHHTHVVLVPGDEWGDETPWLSAVADAVAGSRGSATLLVNGGDITYDDAAASLGAGRLLVVLLGTGRTADAIALARATGAGEARARAIAESPLTQVVDVDDGAGVLAALTSVLEPTTNEEAR
jgi:hypothetical protein